MIGPVVNGAQVLARGGRLHLERFAETTGRKTWDVLGMSKGLEKKAAKKAAAEIASSRKKPIPEKDMAAFLEKTEKKLLAGKGRAAEKAQFTQKLSELQKNRGYWTLEAGLATPFAIPAVGGLLGSTVPGQAYQGNKDLERDLGAMQAMDALDRSRKLKMKRIHDNRQSNLMRAAEHAPHLLAQISAGRELVEGEQVIGGKPRQDLLAALTDQMANSSFQDPYEAML